MSLRRKTPDDIISRWKFITAVFDSHFDRHKNSVVTWIKEELGDLLTSDRDFKNHSKSLEKAIKVLNGIERSLFNPRLELVNDLSTEFMRSIAGVRDYLLRILEGN